MCFASAAGRTFSIALSTRSCGSTGSRLRRRRPVMMRETSSTSPISLAWAWALRSMISRTCGRRSADTGAWRSIETQPRTALSGVRSSCESVARNSSFRRLARSASSRAACSATSTSRSSYCRSRARRAARTVLTTAATRTGRSSSVTLRKSSSAAKVRSSACERSPPAKSRMGTSDQAGCCASAAERCESNGSSSASSVSTIAPAPRSSSSASPVIVGQTSPATDARASRSRVRTASRPTGANTSTRRSCAST